ncbi:MAG: flagellar export chaperone FliS [Acidimicrobiales bacterium]
MSPSENSDVLRDAGTSAHEARQAEAFNRYMADSIRTAPPATMVTMLYQALCDDLATSDDAFDTKDIKAINDSLVHAQQIIIALRDSLRLDLWEGAKGLASLYDFLLNELIAANIHKDRERARSCSGMITQLSAAWQQAAQNAVGEPPGRDASQPVAAVSQSPNGEHPKVRSVINEVA